MNSKASRILLINPPYSTLGGISGHGGKSAPLNLAYLAAFIRQKIKNIDIAIIDSEGLSLTLEQLYEKVKSFMPDIIGITCPTPVYHYVKTICAELKSKIKNVKIILGGPHPTALPKETLQEIDCDAVVIGEGEMSFYELIAAFLNNRGIDNIPGIGFKDNAKIKINPDRELIEDLDMLPFPAKDLLPLEKYYLPPSKRIKSSRATNMVTSRGCPYSCNFCMANTIWKGKTRFRSVENVIEEISLNVKDYNLTEFSFHDEFFTLKRDRLFAICEGIMKDDLRISWVCQTRAGAVDLDMLRLMKRAGCGKIAFGFESGSERMLKLMNKRADLSEAIESVSLCRKAGIQVAGAFILGYPEEDVQSIKETINFALKLECNSVAFFIAIPFPGTKLYFDALEHGYLKKEVNWAEFAPVSNLESPMIIPNLSPAELMRWKRIAYKKYYLRPKYIISRIKDIRSFDDIKDRFRGLNLFRKVALKS